MIDTVFGKRASERSFGNIASPSAFREAEDGLETEKQDDLQSTWNNRYEMVKHGVGRYATVLLGEEENFYAAAAMSPLARHSLRATIDVMFGMLWRTLGPWVAFEW